MTAVDPSGFLILACLAGLVVLLVAARPSRRPVERSEPAPAPDPAAGGVYFVTANVWLIAGLRLLLGARTLYRYGRLEPFVSWRAVSAPCTAAAVRDRRARAAR